jgi:hypothetical protein
MKKFRNRLINECDPIEDDSSSTVDEDILDCTILLNDPYYEKYKDAIIQDLDMSDEGDFLWGDDFEEHF